MFIAAQISFIGVKQLMKLKSKQEARSRRGETWKVWFRRLIIFLASDHKFG